MKMLLENKPKLTIILKLISLQQKTKYIERKVKLNLLLPWLNLSDVTPIKKGKKLNRTVRQN